jgi:hypothetical protein
MKQSIKHNSTSFFSIFWRLRLRTSPRLDPDPEPDPAADLVEPGFENLLHTPITHQGNTALTRAKDTLTTTASNEKKLSSVNQIIAILSTSA